MKTLEILVLVCLAAEALLFVYLVISARQFVRKMKAQDKPGGFKTSFIIDQALSLDL